MRAIEPLIAILTREGTRVPWDVVGALRYFDIPQVNIVLKRLCGEVLVVCIEDNRQMRNTIRDFLESEGFGVLYASDGVRGLELIRRARPDLVLLDLGIPRMDGWEVCQRIRADNHLQDVLVLVMSASKRRVSHGRDLRVDGWLSKPFSLPGLLGAIESVLAGREWE
jgi:DNA-binding response OmpR family regulator